MLVKVESTGTLKRRMRVEMPGEQIEKEISLRLVKVGKTAKIKGFRPGKVPANVVRQHYGAEIRQDVLSDFIQRGYTEAIQQEKLNPAGRPKIEPESLLAGQDFVFVATFEVMPEIELKGLDKIKLERPEVEIGAADQEAMIETLRKQKATWKTVDRKAAEGDRVIVDFVGTLKGEEFPGGKGEEVPVELGQGQMLPDFEKARYGVAAGDEKSFKVKFPKDYRAEDLAGNKVDFNIKVHRVEEQELPALDDAFAEAFGIQEGGLDKLRADVLENMQRQLKERVTADVKEQVMNGLLEANPIAVPSALIDQEIHALQHDAMQRMGITDHDKAPAREHFVELAERRVRLGLLLNQVIIEREIKVDAERVKARIEELCAGYENPAELVARYLATPQVMSQIEPVILEEQAVDALVAGGKEKAKKFGFKEYMNSEKA